MKASKESNVEQKSQSNSIEVIRSSAHLWYGCLRTFVGTDIRIYPKPKEKRKTIINYPKSRISLKGEPKLWPARWVIGRILSVFGVTF